MFVPSLIDKEVSREFLMTDRYCLKQIAGDLGYNYHSFLRVLRHEKPVPASMLAGLYAVTNSTRIVRAALVGTDLTVASYTPPNQQPQDVTMLTIELLAIVVEIQRLAAKYPQGEPMEDEDKAWLKDNMGKAHSLLATVEITMIAPQKEHPE